MELSRIQKTENEFRIRMISRISLAIGIVGCIAVPIRYLISDGGRSSTIAHMISLCVSIVLCQMPRLLKNSSHATFAGYLLVTLIGLIGISSGLFNAGIKAPATALFIILPIVGHLCLGRKGAVISFLMSTLCIGFLLVAEHLSLTSELNNPHLYSEYKAFIYFVISVITYLIGASYEKLRNDANQKISEMTFKLSQASNMFSLGEMANGLAHEVNSPLTIIFGKLRKLRKTISPTAEESKQLFELVDSVEGSLNRVSKIVKGLELFSRIENQDPIDMVTSEKIVENTILLCGEKFKSIGIDLTVRNLAPAEVKCRSSQISQAILNLLRNSFDAIENLDEKWVKIESQVEGSTLQIAVTDSGKGIDRDISERMMEPFFTTKEVGKGTGLGLSIAKGLVEANGGRIFLDETAKNTRFVIELPLSEQRYSSKQAA